MFSCTDSWVCHVCISTTIPITWLKHDTTQIVSSELSAAKKWLASQYRSAIISLQHLTVFSFHQQLTSSLTTPQNLVPQPAVMMWNDRALAWQCTNSEPPPTYQHAASLSRQYWVGKTVAEILDWRVVSGIIMNGSLKISSRQQLARYVVQNKYCNTLKN